MAQTTFTRAAAQAKVGKRVRTRVAFADVPRGAIGTIIRAERVIDGYDVEVAWVWSGRRMPWIDWVTKAEYEVCLIELRDPRDGRPPAAHAQRQPAAEGGLTGLPHASLVCHREDRPGGGPAAEPGFRHV